MNIYIAFIPVLLVFIGVLLFPIYRAKDISKRHRQIFSLIVGLLLCAGSLLFYQKFGTPEILPLLAEREEKIGALKEKIIANSAEVEKDPKNLKAWLELGDNFMESSQFSAAANAYKQAILLSQGKPEIIMAYVHALIIGADGTVTQEAKKSLDMMLVLQPKNEQVRYFLAMYKMQTGDTKNAMAEMKALYKSLSDDSPIKDMIDRQIGRK
jgi:cytochrome c-type biogenesis protein CcmH